MNRQRAEEILEKHYKLSNEKEYTTEVAVNAIIEFAMEQASFISSKQDVIKSVCDCTDGYPTYWLYNKKRCTYCNQEKIEQTVL